MLFTSLGSASIKFSGSFFLVTSLSMELRQKYVSDTIYLTFFTSIKNVFTTFSCIA